MKLDIRSAAIGATLAIGAGVLLSAQAAPALRAVADILAVKVQGAVEVRPQAGSLVRVNALSEATNYSSATDSLLYTVPDGRDAVIRTAKAGAYAMVDIYRVVDPQFNTAPSPSAPDLEHVDRFAWDAPWTSHVGGTAPAAYHFASGEQVWVRGYWDDHGSQPVEIPYYVEFELIPTQ